MSDFVDLTDRKNESGIATSDSAISTDISAEPKSNVPKFDTLKSQLAEASMLVDDIVLKNYLSKLTDLEVVPLDDSMKQISDIRLFRINEMVYQNDEYSTYKFASVFNSVQNLNCGVFIIADSNGKKTDFYMGVRSLDDKRTTKSLKDTLRNALCGQFPGVKTSDLLDPAAIDFLANIGSKNIASVSCVAKNKDEEFKDNERFIQGLEKLALAMQGQRYTAIVLAKSTPTEQLTETRRAYETIYTQLSPFANMQLSYGTNTALNISDAFSSGTTTGTSHSTNTSKQTGSGYSKGTTINESTTEPSVLSSVLKGVVAVAGILAAPVTGGASILAAGMAMGAIPAGSKTTGTSESINHTGNISETTGDSDSTNESKSKNHTKTKGLTSGVSDNMQLTMQNKTLINTLERIDFQLKRIDECESLGMWECAAYFLSDSQETAEMAAGTYRALMKGEKSGVETSAINFWGRNDAKQLPLLREYITNFIHPVFEYTSAHAVVPVTASSLISGNELAVQMGLPRKSVCGFPVIEHADFGKEVVKYNQHSSEHDFALGNIFSMGSENDTAARLDRDSMTMHTFITGSTGAGKSNAVYQILNQLRNIYNIPFLVVEPAKGEYKNIFGHFNDVTVYGTNPKKTKLLRINPFRFPEDIHVLEHLDRLVELFNVCWPMYAAMPAILKKAMERAYEASGWDLQTSTPRYDGIFPLFADVLEQIQLVINESSYSADSKGDYAGALCTRVESLTNGINGMIFCSDGLSDKELFDKSVIVDLSLVGSTETKSLIMGLLVMKLQEHRAATATERNAALRHITVLEEAHNLLKRTSTEQSSESSNLLGKSVELLANSIAEMRTYGEGFIIADQSPGLLDMSVIRNTNTKIILRLPEFSDRELVGKAASLTDEQIVELSKLERGVAAVYQNDWVEPILAKITHSDLKEKRYEYQPDTSSDVRSAKTQLINFLIQGRLNERLEFDAVALERNLARMNISARNKILLSKLIDEYKTSDKLELWMDEKFGRLSAIVTDLLGVRATVENEVVIANNNEELTNRLVDIIRCVYPNSNSIIALALSQCCMRDFAAGRDERERREKIYRNWFESVERKTGGAL